MMNPRGESPSDPRSRVGDGKKLLVQASPERIAARLAAFLPAFALLSLAGPFSIHVLGHPNVLGLVPLSRRLFNLGAELTIPTWFSSMLLFFAAVTASIIARHESPAPSAHRRGWYVVSAVLLYLAIDEVAGLHESFRAIPWTLTDGAEFFPNGRDWILVALPLVVVVAVVLMPWARRLPGRTLGLFAASAGLFLGGSIGLELIEGYFDLVVASDDLIAVFVITVEEIAEMAGSLLALYAMLDYARTRAIRVELGFGAGPGLPPAEVG